MQRGENNSKSFLCPPLFVILPHRIIHRSKSVSFRITKKSRRLVLAMFLVSLLSACGQKGDLYHPEEEEAAAATSRLTA